MIPIIPKNRTKLLAFNTISRASSTIGIAIIGIISLPLKLNYFGIEIFGLYQLVASVVQYLSKTDFGIGTTIKKYVPAMNVKKEYLELGRLIGFSLFFNFLLSLLIAGIIIIIGHLSMNIFSLSSEDAKIFESLAIILAFRIIIDRTLAIFPAFLEGMQRHFVVNAINLLITGFDLLLILYIINAEGTIKEYVLYLTFTQVLFKILIMFCTKYSFGFFNIRAFKLEQIKDQFIFSWNMTKSQIASLLQYESARIILGLFTNPTTVGYFHVGEKIHNIVRQILNQIFSSLMPLIAEKHAENNEKYIKKALFDGSRIVVSICFPVLLVLIFNSKAILRLWLGNEYTFLSLFAALFLVPYFISLPSGIMSNSLIAKGNIKKYMNIKMIAAGLNVITSIILVQFYGIWGVLFGVFIQSGLFNFYLYKDLFEKLRIAPKKFIMEVIYPNIIPLIATFFIIVLLNRLITVKNIMELFLLLTIPVLIFYSLYFILNKNDFMFLKNLIIKKQNK